MEDVTVPREKLEILVDTIASSMDYGSGFLDIEQVEALWAAAEILGIPQIEVTPSEFKHLIPHKFEKWPPPPVVDPLRGIFLYRSENCRHCGKVKDFATHVE